MPLNEILFDFDDQNRVFREALDDFGSYINALLAADATGAIFNGSDGVRVTTSELQALRTLVTNLQRADTGLRGLDGALQGDFEAAANAVTDLLVAEAQRIGLEEPLGRILENSFYNNLPLEVQRQLTLGEREAITLLTDAYTGLLFEAAGDFVQAAAFAVQDVNQLVGSAIERAVESLSPAANF